MKDMEDFVGALLVGDSVQNTIHLFLFLFFNSHWTGFRKIIVQDQNVVAMFSVISKNQKLSRPSSYVTFFFENIVVGLTACCLLSLWGAPGSHLQAFLHVQEGVKLTLQRQMLRFVYS